MLNNERPLRIFILIILIVGAILALFYILSGLEPCRQNDLRCLLTIYLLLK